MLSNNDIIRSFFVNTVFLSFKSKLKSNFKDYDFLSYAIKNKHNNIVKNLNYLNNAHVFNLAIMCRNTVLIKYCIENNYKCDINTIEYAFEYGNLFIIEWLFNNGCYYDEDSIRYAVFYDNIHVVKWWVNKSLNTYALFDYAITQRTEDILKYLLKKNVPYSIENTCNTLLYKNNLNYLEFLNKNNFKHFKELLTYSIKEINCNYDFINYIIKKVYNNNYLDIKKIIEHIIIYKNIDFIKWWIEMSLPTTDMILLAIYYKKYYNLNLLLEMKVPYDSDDVCNCIVDNKDTYILELLNKNNFKHFNKLLTYSIKKSNNELTNNILSIIKIK